MQGCHASCMMSICKIRNDKKGYAVQDMTKLGIVQFLCTLTSLSRPSLPEVLLGQAQCHRLPNEFTEVVMQVKGSTTKKMHHVFG